MAGHESNRAAQMCRKTRRAVMALALFACWQAAWGESTQPYGEFLRGFQSELLTRGAAPQSYRNEAPPSGVHQVSYESGSLGLKAWLALPRRIAAAPVPAVVYLHGGFALGTGDLMDAVPFYKAGYAVMTPMLRAENGNPGSFELMLGEVDDAVEAARWLAAQPFVDADRVYVFGHSVGGGIASLVALRENAPVRHTGSAGGLYTARIFESWRSFAPFDVENDEELRARLLIGNEQWLQTRHYAYVGRGDDIVDAATAGLAASNSHLERLEVEFIDGDHHTSLAEAIAHYLHVMESDRTRP